jgi:valyl-tRNA synthetase
LSNEAFLAKAPEQIVAGMRQKQADYEAQLAKLRASL